MNVTNFLLTLWTMSEKCAVTCFVRNAGSLFRLLWICWGRFLHKMALGWPKGTNDACHLRQEVSLQKANKLFKDDMMRDDHLAEPISDCLSSSKIDNGPPLNNLFLCLWLTLYQNITCTIRTLNWGAHWFLKFCSMLGTTKICKMAAEKR